MTLRPTVAVPAVAELGRSEALPRVADSEN